MTFVNIWDFFYPNYDVISEIYGFYSIFTHILVLLYNIM